tara:strand:- start:286 stop:564 length:279 start_codon:yes stop_codon:yes gene_type:complete
MKTKIPIETLFARRKTTISNKIEEAASDLHDAIVELADLQDEFTLSEPSIEYVDEWSSDAIQSIDTIEHMIRDLDSFLFDGDTVILFDEVED